MDLHVFRSLPTWILNKIFQWHHHMSVIDFALCLHFCSYCAVWIRLKIKPVSVKNLCPQSQLKSAFDQLYNNRPGIQLNNQSESAALVHQIWTNENLQDFQDCVFTVDSNLYSPYGRFGRGIFAAVKKINFRQNAKGECIDYVKFRFAEAVTQRICGNFDDESDLGKSSFFNEGAGVMKVHIFVNKSVPFQALQRSVEIDLLFTAYESEILAFLEF